MGTHPIFESDFDCLTDGKGAEIVAEMSERNSPVESEADESISLVRRRLLHAQKNIEYLQGQHKQTLSELHIEIDRLKLQNKDQQWKLVMAGCGPERLRVDFSAQTSDLGQADRDFRIKVLEEENLDLKSKVESLLKANDKLKNELINRTKSEKLHETRKYHDTKYRSKYQRKEQNTKALPLIPGCKINGNEVHVHFPAQPPQREPGHFHLPALRGVNQTVKHNRRLDAINQRFQY